MTKRWFTALAAIGVLTVGLSACGDSSGDSQASGGGASDATLATSSSAGCDGDVPRSTGPVSLTDSFGRKVELDQPAERVVVLEWQQVEDVLTLCVNPVGVADVDGYATWDTAETLDDSTTDVGGRGEPNIDALLATEPDLVIVEAYTPDDEIIGQLERYDVPVLATKGADAADPIDNMLSTFRLIGEALGREERAEEVVTEFEDSLAEAKATVTSIPFPTTKFVYFDGYLAGGNVALRPFGQGSLMGELGEALGLTNAWTGEVDEAYGLGQTDIEGMTQVGDASLFYTGTDDPTGDDIAAELTKNPVWQSLPAVTQGRVFAFPTGVWTFGGPRSAQQVLNAYVERLTS